MKHIYYAVAAHCLFIAVQSSNAQERIHEFGAGDGELTAVSAKASVPQRSPLDWEIGGLVSGEEAGDQGHPRDGERRIHVNPECVDGVSDYARPAKGAKQAIMVDLKTPISVYDIVGLDIDQKSNGYLIRIHCTKRVPDFESWLKPIGDDTWLYITLADATADVVVLGESELPVFVKKILVFQSATSVQLTFMLKGHVNGAELIPAEGSKDILALIFTSMEEQRANQEARQ